MAKITNHTTRSSICLLGTLLAVTGIGKSYLVTGYNGIDLRFAIRLLISSDKTQETGCGCFVGTRLWASSA